MGPPGTTPPFDRPDAPAIADSTAITRTAIPDVVPAPSDDARGSPKNVFVAGFLNLHMGSPPISLIDARYMPQGQRLGNVWVGVRPEHIEISREQGEDTLRGIIASTLSLPR